MTVNYTSLLSLGQPVTGTESGTWGDDVNNALTAYLDIAIAGTLTFTGDGAVTLSNTQGTSSASNISSTTAQYSILKVVGPLTATKVFTAPSTSKTYIVNNTDATYGVTIKAFGQTGVTVDANRKALVMFNGTDYAFVSGDDITKFLGTLPVSSGGTGQTTFTDGQLLIGNSSGNTLTKATLTAGANVTITNGPGSIQISATGGGGGGGTVTSVALSAGSTGFTVSGSPITTSGTFTLGGTLGVGSGGTGLTATPTNGQLDIGNGSGFTRTTLTAGSGISITNGAGSVTIAATGGGTSGTYTPTVSLPGSTNVASVSANPSQWLRVGNVVTVSGMLTIAAAAPGAVSTIIGLPISLTNPFTSNSQCSGTAVKNGTYEAGFIYGVGTLNTCALNFNATNTSSALMSFVFTYVLV